MRMLITVTLPHKTVNAALRDGTMGPKMNRIFETLKPEQFYFTQNDGLRCVLMIVNMSDPSQLPVVCEPWQLLFEAKVDHRILMTTDDLFNANLFALGKEWGQTD